ncbi:LysR family transcriptional regulator [Pseudomonas azotoformans]|uniref:LysR family transcriptional regulator n=2 Tax=Gammaproteobacteria TaxID=1236 RepID=A0A1V2JPC8_PSEAZ|nr:LysR family transcriptional regulator [Pseudomonas azotoformans]OIN47084.1 LysR family transcriptional regulator [Pseudomonas azotoformans]ONH46985.1 LysR family transcriptional regulator [Pseudomonas azotoformans]SDM82308.1 DNA-binding transcriptional regulator, LysR family [Pseudomonas azotoformans]
MNFSFRHVEVFWAVMTTGSATGAAELLHTSQPTISRELSRFETLTQLTLFKRAGAKLIPTEHGLMLFDEVQRSYVGLARVKNAVEAIKHFRQGQISLTCIPAFSNALLPQVCQDFCSKFPGVSINITPQDSPALEESLTAQRYHLGLTETLETPPGTYIETLLNLDVVCVLPSYHELNAKTVLTPQDFEGQNFVYLAADDPYRRKTDAIFHQSGIERRLVVETHSASAVCATVNLGVGVAIVNPITALDYVGRGLQIRRFSHSISYCVSVVRPLHRPESSTVEHFVDSLRKNCQQISARLEGLDKIKW